jgi:hypothetical protein
MTLSSNANPDSYPDQTQNPEPKTENPFKLLLQTHRDPQKMQIVSEKYLMDL